MSDNTEVAQDLRFCLLTDMLLPLFLYKVANNSPPVQYMSHLATPTAFKSH